MLELLPHPVRILTLVVIGASIGSFINWGIYAWTYFLTRPISPWMKRHPDSLPRKWSDRLPVIGWFGLRRDHPIHGKGFWIRPLLIEVCWAIGLPWFYNWQLGGGLTGGVIQPLPVSWALWTETWFWGHTLLIAFMFIATFIDFDERTIPDLVTIPGTLIALLLAAFCPWFRLPEVVFNLAGQTIEPIHFASADALPLWHQGWVGWIAAVGIWSIWIAALVPKICTLRYGIGRGLKLMIASSIRPKRRTDCPLRMQRRGPFGITLALCGLWLTGVVLILAGWRWLPDLNWDSLFGSLFGLAFGGGMVWSIRIVARFAMQREAMGFGDVTLMAMIGAFLGWQASLLTFAIAPFAALLIVLACFLITKDNELAFGPYLCFGCLMLLLGWAVIWDAARIQFFFLGPILFVFLFIALILMALMLIGIQWIKGPLVSEDDQA